MGEEMEDMESKKSQALRLFFVLTMGISAICEAAIIMLKAMGLAAILMWVPALAAFVTKMVYFRNERGFLGFRPCQFKYILEAILIPLIYIGVPYVIYWILFPGTLQFEMTPDFWWMLVLGIPFAMVTAIGEEIGWRGFMVPALLEKIGVEKALLLSGLIWGLWHVPILASGLYMPGTPIWFKVPMFLVVVIGCGVLIGIITIESKSVWPAAFMHSAHNDFDQAIFGVYTVGDHRMYWVSETGILTALIVWGLVIILYTKMKKDKLA